MPQNAFLFVAILNLNFISSWLYLEHKKDLEEAEKGPHEEKLLPEQESIPENKEVDTHITREIRLKDLEKFNIQDGSIREPNDVT